MKSGVEHRISSHQIAAVFLKLHPCFPMPPLSGMPSGVCGGVLFPGMEVEDGREERLDPPEADRREGIGWGD